MGEVSTQNQQFLVDMLGRPLKDLRISVIDRCNFRCPYCMPANHFPDGYKFLSRREWLSFDEIERLANIFALLGVTKVRLTGGEPLLRPVLSELIAKINTIPGIDDIALTTNGSHLAAFAADLKKSGLRRLTVSLDSCHAKVFRYMSGDRGDLHVVLKGLAMAKECGFLNIKINCVLKRAVNDGDLEHLVEYCLNNGFILRFIEFMDVGNINSWDPKDVLTTKEVIAYLSRFYKFNPLIRLQASETSERFDVDGRGEVGFISSVSKPFCGDCNRLRLSAEGKAYTCLFGSQGLDLRTPLRDGAGDADIMALIRNAWQKRQDRYSELRLQKPTLNTKSKVEMHHIGG